MISKFKSISKSRVVAGEVTFTELMNLITNPGKYKEQIILARIFHQYGDKELYKLIKSNKILSFTINASFRQTRRYDDIKSFSGYIYLDIDQQTDINLNHPLIHASWLSLSRTGRGIVVRVEGLNINNFGEVYHSLGNKLNLKLDKYAAKANQLNVLSFDPNLYYNPNSEIYDAREDLIKKNVFHSPNIIKQRIIGTAAPIEHDFNMRFNNVDEYIETIEFNGEAAIIADNPVGLSEVKIPSPIREGRRNSILVGICFQVRALNHHVKFDRLYNIIYWVSRKHCKPPYPKNQIYQLVKSINSLPTKMLIPRVNTWRRVFYNPDYELTATQKRSLSRKLLNIERSDKIIEKIGEVIYNWQIEIDGKITRTTIAKKANVSYSSAKKYYSLFESYIDENIKKNKPP